jgi:AhpC/TSA family
VTTSRVAILVAALCGACGSSAPAHGPPPGVSTAPLQAAVDFQFESLDERPVSAESTRGKPTVLVLVTTGSVPAQAQVDYLVGMAKHDADRVNYAVVALEPRENRELVAIYRKSLNVTFPVAMADDRTLAGASPFGDVSIVPVTVILDRTGRVAWRADGRVAKSDELRRAMKGL